MGEATSVVNLLHRAGVACHRSRCRGETRYNKVNRRSLAQASEGSTISKNATRSRNQNGLNGGNTKQVGVVLTTDMYASAYSSDVINRELLMRYLAPCVSKERSSGRTKKAILGREQGKQPHGRVWMKQSTGFGEA